MEVIAAVFLGLLLLTGAVVELAARGLLRRNRLAGIRTVATMQSDAAWTAAHRSASLTIWVGFAASVVAAIVSFAADGIVSTVGAIAVAAIFVLISVITLVVANRAGRADRRRMGAASDHRDGIRPQRLNQAGWPFVRSRTGHPSRWTSSIVFETCEREENAGR